MNVKLLELFKDKEFSKKAANCESASEVLSMIEAKGIDITKEEFDSFMKDLARSSNDREEELDESELEQVSGGGFLTAAAVVSAIIAIVGAAKWFIYDEPYSRGKQDAKAKNNRRMNEIC